MRFRDLIVRCATFVVALAVAPAHAQYDEIDSELLFEGQIVVKAASDAAVQRLDARLEEILGDGTVEVLQERNAISLYLVQLPLPITPEEAIDVRAALDDSVDSDHEISWAEPNLRVDVVGGQTGSLWVSGLGIDRSGYKQQYAGTQLDIGSAHSRSIGRGVIVGIVDTGIDPHHEAMEGRVMDVGVSLVPGYPTPHDGASNDPMANNALRGHGTFVAGLVRLVAPGAILLPIRILDSEGQGSTETAAAGIQEAVDRGAHIVVLAFGTPVQNQTLNAAIQYATQRGVLVLAAAGNAGELGCFYPASNPAVFTLAACDHFGMFDPVSNWCGNVNACAPGSMFMSDGLPDPTASIIGPHPSSTGSTHEYRAARGTSFSVGFAAGVAALARAQNPTWPEGEITLPGIPLEIAASLTRGTESVWLPDPVGERPRLDANMATTGFPAAPRVGDVNGDGCIDAADLGLVLGRFGADPQGSSLFLEDLNGDLMVTAADIGLVLSSWDPCSPPARRPR